jgi:hypothetical protein
MFRIEGGSWRWLSVAFVMWNDIVWEPKIYINAEKAIFFPRTISKFWLLELFKDLIKHVAGEQGELLY